MSLLHEVAEYLRGTCNSEQEAQAAFDLSDEQMEGIMGSLELEAETARCEQCGWWMESCELNEDGYCEDCEEENG